MSIKQFILGTLAGTFAYMLSGFLIFTYILTDFFSVYSGLPKETLKAVTKGPDEINGLSLILASICGGALITFIFSKWKEAHSLIGGLKAGAIVGILYGTCGTLGQYSITNIHTVTSGIGDALFLAVSYTIVGGFVGWVVGKTA